MAKNLFHQKNMKETVVKIINRMAAGRSLKQGRSDHTISASYKFVSLSI
jgi:hypothetical protein